MTIYPNVGALKCAATMRTFFALSTLHLFKAITAPLSQSTVVGDFTEADYDGYVEKTLTTWNLPYIDPVGGATIQGGTQQFDFVFSGGITNNIFGFYLLDAAGDLILAGTFDSPIPMAADGDSIPMNVSSNWCAPPV